MHAAMYLHLLGSIHPQHSILSEIAVGDIADKLKGAMVEALSKASPDVKKKLLLQVRG